MHKIQRVSQFFKWAFLITFIGLPLLSILFWIHAPSPVSEMAATHGFMINYIPEGLQAKILHPLTPMTKLAAFIIDLIPLGVNLFILYFLIRLFTFFEKKEFFSLRNVIYIKRIGYALFIGQLLSPIHQVLLTAALTWNNPPAGYRYIAISFTGTNIGILLMALLIILISWIMAEAYKMQEDQKYII